ncbi:nitrile hydratase subunit beta [Patulibacter defluvii]|uniref:nitrile hydratase subunit beta n=1 Tax=Patulibacter defluvii TaxID=3095358 RepID=UPI002A75CD26|nr:nitrile hydratase subunit beta [Patulibacter sp. DM4]
MSDEPPVRNGPHDLGGALGLGPIDPRPDGPTPYPEGWEGHCIGLTIGTMAAGLYGVDEWRMRMEGLPAAAQFAMGYYRRWAYGLESCLEAHGVLTAAEIQDRASAVAAGEGRDERRDPALLERVEGLLRDGGPLLRELPDPPRFAVGDVVRTGRIAVEAPGRSHTRLPGYAQDREGVVDLVHPPMALPDAAALGDDRTEHLYSVRFDAHAIWPDAEPGQSVSADLFESYLRPADEGDVT